VDKVVKAINIKTSDFSIEEGMAVHAKIQIWLKVRI